MTSLELLIAWIVFLSTSALLLITFTHATDSLLQHEKTTIAYEQQRMENRYETAVRIFGFPFPELSKTQMEIS